MLGCACNGMGAAETAEINFFGWDQTNYSTVSGQSTDPGGVSLGNTWTDIWQKGLTTAFGIANARYGGVQPGQYVQNGNSVNYRLPNNSTNFSAFPTAGIGVGSSSSLMTWLLIGGVGLIAIKSLSK